MKKLIFLLLIVLCSCGTFKMTPKSKQIIGTTIIGGIVYSLAPETSNPNLTRNLALAGMATASFTIAITEPSQHRYRRWKN